MIAVASSKQWQRYSMLRMALQLRQWTLSQPQQNLQRLPLFRAFATAKSNDRRNPSISSFDPKNSRKSPIIGAGLLPNQSADAKRVLVLGGSGFLGRQICRAALVRDCHVTSISRSGLPQEFNEQSWVHRVSWERGDLFDLRLYERLVKQHDIVINCVGILLEADYKAVAQGDLAKLPSLLKSMIIGANPLESDTTKQLSYKSVNHDLAIATALAAFKSPKTHTYVYISAADSFPAVPSGYIESKRRTEADLTQISNLRTVFPRPGYMYSEERSISMPIRRIFDATHWLHESANDGLKSIIRRGLGAAALKPVPVELVAIATVQAALDDSTVGPLSLNQMIKLCEIFSQTVNIHRGPRKRKRNI